MTEKDKKWSGEVTEHDKWHPPEGLFKKSAKEIAETLKANSKDEKQAMARLNFYINRAGKNLSEEDRKRLDKAKEILHELYQKDAKKDDKAKDSKKKTKPRALKW